MAWRVLMRRCPARSMTIVGDIAQTGALAGVSSWTATLRPYVRERAAVETLTVNYRTPRAVMALATAVLRAAGVAGRGARLAPRGPVAAGAHAGRAAGPAVAAGGAGRAGPAGDRHARGDRAARHGSGAGRGGGPAGRAGPVPGVRADRRAGQGAGVRHRGAGRAGRRSWPSPGAAPTTSTSRSPGPPSGCTCCTRARCRPASSRRQPGSRAGRGGWAPGPRARAGGRRRARSPG